MKPYIIVIAVVVLGGLGYVGYSQMHQNAPEIAALDADLTPPAAAPASGKKMAFSQFVKQGGSYECTVKQALSDMENSGTVYMDKGRMRGEFSTIAEGMKVDTSLIVRDDYTYTWSSMMPKTGFKIKVQAEMNNTGAPASGTYSWNADQIGEYDCKAWVVDESKFTLPSGTTFTEVKS